MKSLILISMFLTGCASGNITASPSSSIPVFVRNTQGQTVARIQDSNVYKPDGTRVARIASDGNIYNTSGVRVGRISK